MKKYIVMGDTIISKNDGQVHYISATQLIYLYGVNPSECVILTSFKDISTKVGAMLVESYQIERVDGRRGALNKVPTVSTLMNEEEQRKLKTFDIDQLADMIWLRPLYDGNYREWLEHKKRKG